MRVLRTSVLAVVILAPITVNGIDKLADPRFVVLGTDGKIVADADPRQYLLKKMPSVFVQRASELQDDSLHPSEIKRYERFSTDERVKEDPHSADQQPNKLFIEEIEKLEDPYGEVVEEEMEGDEFAGSVDFPIESIELPSSFFLDTEVPAVHGSIVFAELSCLFVAFIGYLVHSTRLWDGFSRGQKYCLGVVFASAVLYQGAAFAWYIGILSPDVILGFSSLITRMISLGMVPITTTSFMGRARELCHEQQPSSSSSSSRSSRRQRQRARYS